MNLRLLAICLAAALVGLCPTGRADSTLTFQDFYDALAPDGDWVEVSGYGYCWRPSVDEDWRPYTDGQWVYTEAGYTWFSDEPWGWATYHYGRWTKVKTWGWVWVPGYEWGPAWVSWRANDDYIGWAALPPEAVWQPSSGFSVFVDIDYGIGPDWYTFCPVASFCAPRLRSACLPWRDNLSLIARTENITRIRSGGGGIICNDGPDVALINRRSILPLRRARLERDVNCDASALRERRLRSRLDNEVLVVPAPRITGGGGRPGAIAGRAATSQINRGWEIARQKPELANAYRDKMRRDADRWGRAPHADFLSVSAVPVAPPLSADTSARVSPEGRLAPPSGAQSVYDPSPNPPLHPPERHRDRQDIPSTPWYPQQGQHDEQVRRRLAEQRELQFQQTAQTENRRQVQQQAAEVLRQSQQQRLEAAEADRRRQEREARERLARAQRQTHPETAQPNPPPHNEARRQREQLQQQQWQRQLEMQRELQQRIRQQSQQQRPQRQNRPPGY